MGDSKTGTLTDAEIDAIERSPAGPSPERERYIEQFISTCRAERKRADELERRCNDQAVAYQELADDWSAVQKQLAEQTKLRREADAVIAGEWGEGEEAKEVNGAHIIAARVRHREGV